MNPFWRDISQAYRPPVFLPDIGTFFNQDLELAERLLHKVANSGARYIKGELLHDAGICLNTEACEQYLGNDARPQKENYRALIERKTVSLDAYRELFSPCKDLNLGMVFSVYDFVGADFAVEIGAQALKIASTNVVHAPLIRHCAELGLPLIIDTGKSMLSEAQRAVDWASNAGASEIVVEYSPPAPPAPLERHHLQVLPDLGKLFDLPIGLSDHHHGEEMLFAATALGCRVLEKGVCDVHNSADQDVFHALPVDQLENTIRQCNNIHAALGEAHAAFPPPSERPTARMGLVAALALQAGDILSLDNTRFAFPTLGIPVEDWDSAQGCKLKQDIPADTPLEWQHVQR